MVEWQIVAAVLVVISLILLFLIIKKGIGESVKVIDALLKKVKYTFCCNLFGCEKPIGFAKPLCWACFGCFCGESC
jgi:hypothetical protein